LLKTKQNRSKIFKLVKLFLFIGVLFIVYWQIKNFNEDSWSEFNITQPLSLVLGVFLVFLNIWLAFLKWKITVSVVAPSTSRYVKMQSFFAGIVTGMLTPNMVGNFIGRFYYFRRSHRVNITLFTLLSNYAQFLASLAFGWIAILILGEISVFNNLNDLSLWIGITLIMAIIVYFFIDNLLFRFRRRNYFVDFHQILIKNRTYRIKLLGLSLLRFTVFTSQFALVLNAFGEQIHFDTILAIWQVYLLTMIIPSIFLGKIGVRESISLLVLAGIGMNEFAVLFASLIIWFVNSLSPALVGLIICKNRNDVH